MEKKRKIKCDCGGIFEEKKSIIHDIKTTALVCSKCGFMALDLIQAKQFQKLKALKEDLEQERKIIQIGNSTGITFPEKLLKHGFSKGSKVKLELIDEKSFKVSMV